MFHDRLGDDPVALLSFLFLFLVKVLFEITRESNRRQGGAEGEGGAGSPTQGSIPEPQDHNLSLKQMLN